MAASGSFEKWLGVNYRVIIDWTEGAKDIANNTTDVTFVCTFVSGASAANFTIGANTDEITANGQTFKPTRSAISIKGIQTKQLWSYTAKLPHDSDGSFKNKAVSCKVNLELYLQSGSYPSVTASTTMTLESIARASSMTISGTTLGSKVTFKVTAASTAFKHTLTYKYGSATGTIFSDKAAGTYTYTPPLDLAEQFKTAKSGTVTYTLTTKNGSTTVGTQTYTSKWSIPSSAAPTVSLGWASIDPYNEGAAAAVAAFVQGYSKAQVTFNASKISLKYGASVSSYKIVCNGVTDSASPYRTGTLNGTSASITCTVTDSRGYTASETFDIVLLPYSKPTLTDISLYRAKNDVGEADSSGTYIYAKAKLTYSDLDGQNECQLLGYYRAQSGKYGEGIPLANNAGNTLTAAALTTQTYVAKIVATDSLGNSVSYEATIPTDSVAFHIKAGGKGAAFGKYCEDDNLLDIAWNVRFGGRVDGVAPAIINLGSDNLGGEDFIAAVDPVFNGMASAEERRLVWWDGNGRRWFGSLFKANSTNGSIYAESGYGGAYLAPQTRRKENGVWGEWTPIRPGTVSITTTGEDLDNYTIPGWYYFKEAPTGIPGGVNGWLQVADAPGISVIKQLWYRLGTPGTNDYQTWVRTYSSNGGWGSWRRFMTADDAFLTARTVSLATASQTDYTLTSISAYSRSGVVDIHINADVEVSATSWITIATLPSGYRPPTNIYKDVPYWNATSNAQNLRMRITTAGAVQLNRGQVGSAYAFHDTFVMA